MPKAIPGEKLEPLFQSSVSGFTRRSTTAAHHRELDVSEVVGVYTGPSGSSLIMSIADLGNQPKLYRNFLTGGGLRQSPVGNSFGLSFRQASLQGSASYGLVLGQTSPAFVGQTSGVVGMAQASQSVQFSPQASPQFSPQASPQFSPQASPQFSPQASPQFSPQASPQFSPQASPQFSPQASPQFSPQASPQFSPQASPQFSPQASPQFSPQASPQFSPQASFVLSRPVDAGQPSLHAGTAVLPPNQVSDLLQRSGVDVQRLAQISQESPFSLSQASSPADGSYIRAFGLDTGQDVAGWELYDGINKNGALLLGVNDRVGILVEGTRIFPDVLLAIASKLKFDQLVQLIGSHG